MSNISHIADKRLKVFGVERDEKGLTTRCSIGVGSKVVGSIEKIGLAEFEASIGPARGRSMSPVSAARLAWIRFNSDAFSAAG